MHQPHFRAGHHQGFSLIELLAVVAITCVLSSFGVVAFTQIVSSRSSANTADSLSGIIRSARAFAIAQNTYAVVGLRNATHENNPVVEVSISYSLDGNEPVASADLSPTLAAKEKPYRFKQVHIQPQASALDKALSDALPVSDQFAGLNNFEVPFVAPSSPGSFQWRLLITPSGEMSLQTADVLTPAAIIGISILRSPLDKIPPASSAVVVRGVIGQASAIHP